MKIVVQIFSIFIFLMLISFNSTYNVVTNSKQEVNYIPYYLKVYRADSLFLINDFEGSYKILDSLFKKYEPIEMDNYYEYGIYLSSAVMSKHLENFKKKVEYGYTKFGGITTLHKDYSKIREMVHEAADLDDEAIASLKKEYANSLNSTLRNEMLDMYKKDQEFRQSRNDASIDSLDLVNDKKFEEIFKNYDYPKKSLIGGFSAYDMEGGDIRVLTMFLHLDDKLKAKYMPLLLENLKKGNCAPDVYASVYDRLVLNTINKQNYGSFYCSEFELCELISPEKIDSIRKSIGLPHKNYYDWKLKQF